jgi:flagellar protein FlaH
MDEYRDSKDEDLDKGSNKYLDIQLDRDQFHEKIGGSIPLNSLVLIEGKDGYGKSIISQRISYALLKRKIPVTYITTELSTKDFIEQMDSLNYGVMEAILDQKLLIIPMFPQMGEVKLKKDFIDRLLGAKPLFESTVIIIDTFSYLFVQESIAPNKVFDVVKFFKKIINSGKTVIFTVDPDHLNREMLTLLRSVADVYFELSMTTLGGDIKKVIKINRFKKAQRAVAQTFAFRVEPGIGLLIDIGGLT